MEQLKSCPFCGGTAIKGDSEVWCGECFAATNETCTPTAEWNKRVESKELDQANKRIKELEKQRTTWHESFDVELEDNNNLRARVKDLEAKLREVANLRDSGVDEVINYLLDNTDEIKQLLGDK